MDYIYHFLEPDYHNLVKDNPFHPHPGLQALYLHISVMQLALKAAVIFAAASHLMKNINAKYLITDISPLNDLFTFN